MPELNSMPLILRTAHQSTESDDTDSLSTDEVYETDAFSLRLAGDVYLLRLYVIDNNDKNRVADIFQEASLAYQCEHEYLHEYPHYIVVTSEVKTDIALAFQKAVTFYPALGNFFDGISDFLGLRVNAEEQFPVSSWFRLPTKECYSDDNYRHFRQASKSTKLVEDLCVYQRKGLYYLEIGSNAELNLTTLESFFEAAYIPICRESGRSIFLFGITIISKVKEDIIAVIQQLLTVEPSLRLLVDQLCAVLKLENKIDMQQPYTVSHWFQQEGAHYYGKEVFFRQADRHANLISALSIVRRKKDFYLRLNVKSNLNEILRESDGAIKNNLDEINRIRDKKAQEKFAIIGGLFKEAKIVASYDLLMRTVTVESLSKEDIAVAIQLLVEKEPSLKLLLEEFEKFLDLKIGSQMNYQVSRWFVLSGDYIDLIYQQSERNAIAITALLLPQYIYAQDYKLGIGVKDKNNKIGIENFLREKGLQIKEGCEDRVVRVVFEALPEIVLAMELLISLEPGLYELLPRLGEYYGKKQLFQMAESEPKREPKIAPQSEPKRGQPHEKRTARKVTREREHIPLSQYYLFAPQCSGRRGSQRSAQPQASRTQEWNRNKNTHHKLHR